MSDCTDNQDVGLEAATIQGVRNAHWSSGRARIIQQGSSMEPKPRTPSLPRVVGERSHSGEAAAEASGVEGWEVRMLA